MDDRASRNNKYSILIRESYNTKFGLHFGGDKMCKAKMGNLFAAGVAILLLVSSSSSLELKQSNGIFSYKLYQAILAEDPKDIVLSPFSVLADLTMAYLGARGQTATELATALELTESKASTAEAFRLLLEPLQDKSSALSVVNKIYVNCGVKVKPEYNAGIAQDFFSPVDRLNFRNAPRSAGIINQYVANHTNNLITNLVDPSMLSASTQVVLVNAVYFKSSWQFPFNKRLTKKETFFTGSTGSSVLVDTMHLTKRLLYADLPELNAQIVGLAYKNQDYCLHMLIPNGQTGLSDLESRLRNTDLSSFTDRMTFRLIDLSMPKFKTTFKVSLNSPLQKLGIRKAFTGSADFGDLLVNAHNVGITDVVHQAYIKVDEGGTEAAAATAIIMSRMAVVEQEDPYQIRLDHPFFYYLEDLQHNVFFVGRYMGTV